MASIWSLLQHLDYVIFLGPGCLKRVWTTPTPVASLRSMTVLPFQVVPGACTFFKPAELIGRDRPAVNPCVKPGMSQ